MASLSEKYTKLVNDIENHISDNNEKNYVIKKIEEISYIYMELIDRMTKLDVEKIEKIENNQNKIEETLSKIKETVELIKSDIYEDECYDFEIVCPYCNHEFIADIEAELREEIECPECHNIIELDWDEEHECNGECLKNDCTSCKKHEEDDDM